MIEDAYRAFGRGARRAGQPEVRAPYHYVLTPIEPIRRVTWTQAAAVTLDAGVVADLYGVPPWLIDAKYDTRKEHLRWRLRYVRRAWRWCKRKVRHARPSF